MPIPNRSILQARGLYARLIAASLLLAGSLGLMYKTGAAYAFPSPLYVAVNGALLLLALPNLIRCFTSMLREARVSADLLVLVMAALAVGTGRWLEAGAMVFISLLAETLQAAATHRALKELSFAGALESRRVLIKEGQDVREAAFQDVVKDQVVVVRQGQMIPVDGVVVAGKAEVMEASLTGESTYQVRVPGHRVLAGGIAESGSLEIRAEKVGAETMMAHVDGLVNQAIRRQTRRESFMDRFSRFYVSGVLILGVIVFMVYGQFMFANEAISSLEALRRALTIMLAVSPMGLVAAGPLAVYAGLLRAMRRGILFKGGDVLENLARVKILLLDKTGTLTYARPKVASVKSFGGSEEALIDAALLVEQHSGHPIARAICEYGAQRQRRGEAADRFHEFEGGGACAVKGDELIKVGALWLMEDGREIGADVTAWLNEARAHGYTAVLVADKVRILGGFALEDAIREDARTVLQKLRQAGIRRLIMITGDSRETAERVQKSVGVDEVVAECMPDRKMLRLAEEKRRGQWVGMVGDGINDAPALAAADVGIAMSAMGSDMAIEAADVALMNNDLQGLYEAVVGSRQTVQTIKINLALALAVNLLLLGLALFDKVTLLSGAVLQIAVLLLVGANSAVLFFRRARL
ncbi:MAG TPA: hypothetical protein DCZ95_00840 [Verrucomicrobia bacterium]|nr:MAG: hypothetical protein A2X46_16765 [Lentisphaerae bacterium GWF2_57_35]HBA82614.1 hypothetical protein [Verrucomicrobiota bacterium]